MKITLSSGKELELTEVEVAELRGLIGMVTITYPQVKPVPYYPPVQPYTWPYLVITCQTNGNK